MCVCLYAHPLSHTAQVSSTTMGKYIVITCSLWLSWIPQWFRLRCDGISICGWNYYLSLPLHGMEVGLQAWLDSINRSTPQSSPLLPSPLPPPSLPPSLLTPELIPYEQVVQQLAEDTVNTHCGLGHGSNRFICGEIAQAAFVTIKVTSYVTSRSHASHMHVM